MENHINTVHKGSRPYQCNFCNNSFAENTTLKKHILAIHKKKKPFKCTICDRGFAQRVHMTKHIATVHEGKRNSIAPVVITFVHRKELCKIY